MEGTRKPFNERWKRRNERHDAKGNDNLLLRSCFCNSAGNDVGNNVTRLDECEEKLAYFPKATNWV